MLKHLERALSRHRLAGLGGSAAAALRPQLIWPLLKRRSAIGIPRPEMPKRKSAIARDYQEAAKRTRRRVTSRIAGSGGSRYLRRFAPADGRNKSSNGVGEIALASIRCAMPNSRRCD